MEINLRKSIASIFVSVIAQGDYTTSVTEFSYT